MSSQLPDAGDAAARGEEDTSPKAIILRDVVMQGRVALARPQDRARQPGGIAERQAVSSPPTVSSPGLAHLPASRRAEPAVPARPALADEVRIEEEARQRGYEEGFAKGSIEGRARGDEEARQRAAQAAEKASREFEEHAQRLTRELKQEALAGYQARVRVLDGLIAALPPGIEARLAGAEDDMLALCFEVVCRVLGESVIRPEALRAHLAKAMQELRGRKLAAIHMHPDDLALLQEEGRESWASGGVQWIASTDVELGGCILQSPEGGLDARFETQLNALRESLLQTRAVARTSES
ncbi:FliH/SctL family protein [Variovorax sp. CAN2819]|uniref:FliH/SctL family protein n=1 Tax=Variovorax sp. CAN15 TaxID=3046727 RepID=UPI00264A434A|nr:FliH/SctL family protein [Variovorax sp. CAN15]MDN6886192.1 FliH/SctL family protein [Variovorax sp. CAN15]